MGSGKTENRGSSRGLRALIVTALVGANIFVMALSGYSLYVSRQQHEARAAVLSQNVAEAIDGSLTRSIEKIDLALKAIAHEFEHQFAQGHIDKPAIEALLTQYESWLPEVEAIRVADADGLVIFGKGLDPAERSNWADRDYFIHLRDHPDGGLQISKPRMGRVAKRMIVGFARRYNHPDGSFAGVISAPVALDHFAGLLTGFNLGPNGIVVLRDTDLGLIARNPPMSDFPVGTVGNSNVSSELRELARSGVASATYHAKMTADGVERNSSFRRLSLAPMIVIAGIATEDYLSDWYTEVERTALGVAGFVLLSVLSAGLVFHLLNRVGREGVRNELYLHHACDGIHILDEHGNVIQASDHFCAMLGYGRDEVIGMNVAQWDAKWPEQVLLEEMLPRLLGSHEATGFETRHRRKDGAVIEVEINVVGFDLDGKRCLFASARDIGEKKRQQQALMESEVRLRQSEERYRLLLANSPVGILHYDSNLIATYTNERFAEIMQVPREHMQGLDCSKLQDNVVVPPMRRALAGENARYEGPYVTSYGHLKLWISMSCAPVVNAQGEILGGVVILEDITPRRRAESELRLAASVFTHAHEGIMICDADQTIMDVNPTFSEITGYARDEVIGRTPRILNSDRHDKDFYLAMWRAIETDGHWQGEIWNRRKDGGVYPESLTISSVHDDEGRVTHYIGTFTDISAFKEHQVQLEHLAHYDALTQLPNRALLSDRMAHALAQARRAGTLLAVCYLDLDGFKEINDRYGHDAGDALLIEVGRRLRETLRGGDTIARLGGDEFVLLLSGIGSLEECDRAVVRVLRAIAAPVRIGDHECTVSGSIGITLFPHDESDADTLLRHADQAMYVAKQTGKNRYQLYDSSRDQQARSRKEAIARIAQALDSREFRLYYQPIVDMLRGTVIGFEGLVRWQHPERGLLQPEDFLPLVEGTELDVALGRWVLSEGTRQLAEWRRQGMNQSLSLNVSATHLLSSGFVEELTGLLSAHSELEPHALEIEIMEAAAIEDLEATIGVFHGCREAGVDIALDDFGTGYSSLSYFRRLPVDTLKIDQIFVQSLLGNAEDFAVVDSVINLTRAFNRKMVAEGVETVEIGMLLLSMGCNVGQGYGIARPMPAQAVQDWTTNFVPDSNWSSPAMHFTRDDLPLFMAELDHRAWIRQMETWLTGTGENAPSALDSHECRFGRWYDGDGQQRYGRFASFKPLGEMHKAVHEVARELVKLRAEGKDHELCARLNELFRRRDDLIDQLAALQAEVVIEKI